MGLLTLHLSSQASLCSSSSHNSHHNFTKSHKSLKPSFNLNRPTTVRTKIRAVGTVPEKDSQATEPEEPPSVGFAFVSVSLKLVYMSFYDEKLATLDVRQVKKETQLMIFDVGVFNFCGLVCFASRWKPRYTISKCSWWPETQKHHAGSQC